MSEKKKPFAKFIESFNRLSFSNEPRSKYLRVKLREFLEPIDPQKFYYFFTIKCNGRYSHKADIAGLDWFIQFIIEIQESRINPSTAVYIFEIDGLGQLHVHGYLISRSVIDYSTIPRPKGCRIDFQLIEAFLHDVYYHCVNCLYVDGIKFTECYYCTKVTINKEAIEQYMFKSNLPLLVISDCIPLSNLKYPNTIRVFWDGENQI